jgi:integrase
VRVIFSTETSAADVVDGGNFEEHRAVVAEALLTMDTLEAVGKPKPKTFETLKHTCATLLLLNNVHPRSVQKLLGHATIAITLDTYVMYSPAWKI